MSNTPAAQLARLKVIYSRWRISLDDSSGIGVFMAEERYGRRRRLFGGSAAELEHELIRVVRSDG